MRYRHTQHGRFHYLLFPVAAIPLVCLRPAAAELGVAGGAGLLALAALFLLLALCFASLTVSEEDEHLRIAYGPFPLVRRRVRYADIRSVRRARSRVIDGWGIHWIPGRGWTWNLWGFDCVELELERGRLRLGTDDPEGLLDHLARRSSAASDRAPATAP